MKSFAERKESWLTSIEGLGRLWRQLSFDSGQQVRGRGR